MRNPMWITAPDLHTEVLPHGISFTDALCHVASTFYLCHFTAPLILSDSPIMDDIITSQTTALRYHLGVG